jgi:hypothetical protein
MEQPQKEVSLTSLGVHKALLYLKINVCHLTPDCVIQFLLFNKYIYAELICNAFEFANAYPWMLNVTLSSVIHLQVYMIMLSLLAPFILLIFHFVTYLLK